MADEYLTPAEFAALTVDRQCDVWAAVERGCVRWIAVRSIRRYHRADVALLLAQACAECKGTGLVDVDHCNCGVGPSGYYGMHERYCGTDACPNGCWDVLNPAVTA